MANNISFFAKRLCVKQYLNCGIIAAAAPLLAYPSCLGKNFFCYTSKFSNKETGIPPAYMKCSVVKRRAVATTTHWSKCI